MQYFMHRHRNSLIRLCAGTLLGLIVLTLSLTVAPMFAPNGMRNVLPILIFGGASLYFSAGIVIANDWKLLERLGGIAMTAFFAFWMGAVVGSDTGMDVVSNPAYGWFLGVLCCALALIGGLVGIIVPRTKDLLSLKGGWRLATRRY